MRLSYIIQNNDRDFFEKNNHFFLMKHMGSHVLEKRKITAKPVVLRCRCCTFNYIMSEKYSRSQILSYLRQIKLPRFIVTSAWRVGGEQSKFHSPGDGTESRRGGAYGMGDT
jgi:hypothetical protein